jgi:hypothetical protein
MKKNSGFLVMVMVLVTLMGACSDVSGDDASNGIDELVPEERKYSGVFPVENEAQLRGFVTLIITTTQPGDYLINLKKDIEITGDDGIVLGDLGAIMEDTDQSVPKTTVIRGEGGMHTITNTADKSTPLFLVEANNTLELGDNVTLDNGGKDTPAVFACFGDLVMKGNSKITKGGKSGVILYKGKFTMEGGEISGNSGEIGGGVWVYTGSTFTMTGGTISGNTAIYGGGVAVEGEKVEEGDGIFEMKGGEISGNTGDFGGGVYVGDVDTFTKSGGTIDESNKAKYGKVAYVVDGPTIREGTAGSVDVLIYNSKDERENEGWDE